MYPRQFNPRYVMAARKAAIRRTLAVGAIVAIPTACGNNDADVFTVVTTQAPTTVPATQAPTTVPATQAPTTVPATQAPATQAPTTVPATTAPATQAPTVAPDTTVVATVGEVVVDFTYQVSDDGGRARNPYIAVWVEDASGALVQTISVWHKSGNDRWLNELSAWYNASNAGQSSAETTGATRGAGTYSVVWDGVGADGAAVPAGQYVLWVESARERGPHSATSTPITLGAGATTVSAPDDGELSGVAVTIGA